MFKGINGNYPKTVSNADCFNYALERCFGEDKAAFSRWLVANAIDVLKCLTNEEDLEWFKHELVGWWFSGDWVYESEANYYV